jgi:hypothetical protein
MKYGAAAIQRLAFHCEIPYRDPEPVGHVASAGTTPELAMVALGDQPEELTLGTRDLSMRIVDRFDQFVIAAFTLQGHPGPQLGHGGGCVNAIEQTFDCQEVRNRFPGNLERRRPVTGPGQKGKVGPDHEMRSSPRDGPAMLDSVELASALRGTSHQLR